MIYILIIVVIAALGTPLFTVIAGTSIVNFLGINQKIILVPQEIAGIATTPLLYSIPLFTFAGYMLASGNASRRLVRLSKAAIGWMPGGLPIVTLLTCALFTAFTGASGVTIVALGAFLLPMLLSQKYDKNFTYGLLTTSGSIGLLFPPSLPLILFGVFSGALIDKLFIAGILPGMIIIIVYSLYAVYVSKRKEIAVTKFSYKELKEAFWEIKWEAPLPILLFAGVYSGFMAVSDAAAFTAVYVLIVEVFVYKDVKLKDMPEIMKASMVLVGGIIIIMSCALAATNYVVYTGLPQKLLLFVQNFITSKWMFLIILNIFLLIAGSFLELYSSLVILVPLILPIAEAYNINTIHLGIIFLANLEIGFLMPPFGLNLFIASLRFEKPVVDFFRPAVKFLILSFFALMLITYIPQMSTWFLEKPSIVGQWENSRDDGSVDRIILKSGGKFLRKKGALIDIMMSDPVKGSYSIVKDKIILTENSGSEEYNYEIYNDGKRILLKIPEKEEGVFYKNLISPPLAETEGKFLGSWKNQNIGIEFYFNNQVKWIENGIEESFNYKISGSKLLIKKSDDGKNNISYKFKFENNGKTLILKNKSEEIRLELGDSISEM